MTETFDRDDSADYLADTKAAAAYLEAALEEGGDDPAFVHRLFGWIGSHPRVRMAVYNQGALTDGPFRLYRFPRSRAALKAALAHRRFAL